MGKLKSKKAKIRRPLVYVYTGEGGGKTVTAFGIALRALGYDQRVSVVQFMKGRESGEYKARKMLGKNFTIRRFGRKGFVNLAKPSVRDIGLAQQGLRYAAKAVAQKPDVMVMDEINLAVRIGLVGEHEVIGLINNATPKTTFVLTGRYATRGIARRADFVNELVPRKQPKKPWKFTRRGIQY